MMLQTDVLTRVAVIAGIVGSALIIGKIAYLLLLHPLARFPGPFLAKFTDLYAAYHAYIGDVHEDIRRCHDRYGVHVRYAPNRLLFDDAHAVNDIYGLKSSLTKASVYDVLVHKAANTLTLRNKAEHLRRRRIMGQGFSSSALRGFESDIVSFINTLCAQLQPSKLNEKSGRSSTWSSPTDMSHWFDRLTFDIMSKIIFSQDTDTLQQERWRHVADSIAESNVRMGTLLQSPSLSTWRMDKRLFPQSIEGRNRFVRFVSETMRRRVSAAKEEMTKSDIFGYFQDAVDPMTGGKLSMSELTAEAATLIVAGSDTSSTAMTASLFYILHDPIAHKAVNEEVRSAFSSADEIRGGSALNNCKYLRACIDEALRLAPPAGGPLWREVPLEGAKIADVVLPRGVDVGVGVYSMHHNASQFPEPYSFKPGRWLQDSGAGDREASAYMPFSIGQRSCIGKHLALSELALTLATLFWTFDMEAGQDMPADFVLKDHITGTKAPVPVKFSLREVS